MDKRKKHNYIRMVVSILALAIIIVSDYKLITMHLDYKKSDTLYKNTQNDFSKEVGENDIEIDFDNLKKINSDIVGWIYFENEDINYPVLYSEDGENYLRKSYTGEYMMAGSIFITGDNSPDFSDRHTIVYGHNMKNLSMFGKLKYYRQKEDYYEDHQYFRIITPDNSYRYKIFSYREVDENSEAYRVNFTSDDEFLDFVNNDLISDSLVCSDVEFGEESKIITLSTCSERDKRFIVSAIRIEE